MFKSFVILLTIQIFLKQARSDPNKNIKYEISVTTPLFTYEKSIHSEGVIKSKENAFSITVLSNFAVLSPGILEITPETYYFWMDNQHLQKIIPGAFDHQNITEEIRLSGNKLSVISSGTFKNLKIKKLDLSYNKITNIEEDAISDMPNLCEVHLSRNKISEFHQNSFVNTPKMSSFDLTYNKLKKLDEKWFTFMKKDEAVMVGLGYNKIREIHPLAFEGVKLWNLDLAHNKLSYIPEQVFRENELVLLMLNDNKLVILPDGFFEQENLTDVNLRGNFLHCETVKKLKTFSEKPDLRLYFDGANC